jgi:hypothetical protein
LAQNDCGAHRCAPHAWLGWSMIRKSVKRFSEKIMLKQELKRDDDLIAL